MYICLAKNGNRFSEFNHRQMPHYRQSTYKETHLEVIKETIYRTRKDYADQD